jgi:exopolysaccharide production protein ExoQ
MSDARRLPPSRLAAIEEAMGSAPVAQALAWCVLGVAFGAPAIGRVIGIPGLVAMLVALVAGAILVLIARRRYLDWHGLLPLSIIAFIVWCAVSVAWSGYPQESLEGLFDLTVYAFLGLTVALTRDLIQIVRTTGAVLRVLLTASLLLEVASGIIFDQPIAFLGIEGLLANGGPIQGLFETRNLLGMVTSIALVTFIIEWRTRSVPKAVAQYSIAIALLCLFFSGSPVTLIVVLVLAVASLALYGLRRARPEARRVLQGVLLGVGSLSLIVAYLVRTRIIDLLNAGSEFEVRYRLWLRVWDWIQVSPLEGWGWIGRWHAEAPYTYITLVVGREHGSSLNAFLDVYLQVGLVGIFLFVLLCGFAFLRSWLLASNRRSTVYAWPALVLVALLATGLTESFLLVEAGWLLLVICAVKGSQGMSWRSRLPAKPPPATGPAPSHPETLP